ncbi:MAG: hypothetical protein OHK0053_03500 [Microscillaceae bacterium]
MKKYCTSPLFSNPFILLAFLSFPGLIAGLRFKDTPFGFPLKDFTLFPPAVLAMEVKVSHQHYDVLMDELHISSEANFNESATQEVSLRASQALKDLLAHEKSDFEAVAFDKIDSANHVRTALSQHSELRKLASGRPIQGYPIQDLLAFYLKRSTKKYSLLPIYIEIGKVNRASGRLFPDSQSDPALLIVNNSDKTVHFFKDYHSHRAYKDARQLQKIYLLLFEYYKMSTKGR